ncbi:MAG: hypothetical protein IJ588_11925 [Prevotella sp.]|nr:hypothetical protein [Prevotella sp.]
MTIKVKGTYLVNDDSISTTVNPDGVYCYIEAGDYPEPVNANDSKRTMELKEIDEYIYENRESEADRKSNAIKKIMLKFWQWEKEPIRMTKNHLMIGYKVMLKKK